MILTRKKEAIHTELFEVSSLLPKLMQANHLTTSQQNYPL